MSYLGTNKIGKMYLGSTAIGKAYLGNDLVFQQGGAQPVMIPYIRGGGSGGSYIDTGITADNNTRVIVWARNFNPNGGILFGSRVAFQNAAYTVGAVTGTSSCRIQFCIGNTYTYRTTTGTEERYMCSYHKYEIDGNKFYVDDTLLMTSSSSLSSSNGVNIHLLGLNNNGTHINMTLPADICACQIYKGGVLVRDYTAVNTPSVGLYDAVSQTLFTNAGSGSFIYGEFDENAYTPLEYIEYNGSQYFDTNIYGNGSMPFVLKYMPKGSAVWPNIFGARTSSSSKRYELAFGNTSTPYKEAIFAYNNGTKTITNSTTMKDIATVFVLSNASFQVFQNNTSKGSVSITNTTFTTDYTIMVGGCNVAGNYVKSGAGNIYYLNFGSSGNFVPAQKGSRIGMYDTYNDVFYPSATDTPFIAGPTI